MCFRTVHPDQEEAVFVPSIPRGRSGVAQRMLTAPTPRYAHASEWTPALSEGDTPDGRGREDLG